MHDLNTVLRAIEAVGSSDRMPGETAVPTFGRILREIESQSHPHRHLRGLIRKLAAATGTVCTTELLEAYEDAAGHRTDEDQTRAYRELIRDGNLKRMPSPGAFLLSCGVPKLLRDGSRPE